MKDLIAKLRDTQDVTIASTSARLKAADLLERIYAQPVELPEAELMNIAMEKVDSQGQCPVDAYYSADQLTKAVQEATARALEAAAKECDKHMLDSKLVHNNAVLGCVQAIRNLIGRVK